MEELSKWNCIIEAVDGIGAVYLGDIDCAQNDFLLKSLGIGAVLSIIDDPKVTVPRNVVQQVIPIPDSPQQNIMDILPHCVQILD